MVIGAAGLAVGFAVAGFGLVTALGVALQRAADKEALSTAHDVAALVAVGAAPNPLPVAGGRYVQLIDGADRVRSASLGADRLTPFVTPDELSRLRDGGRLVVDGSRLALVGPVRLVGAPAGPDATVAVATPMADIRQSVSALSRVLWLAYPVILLALALLAWRVTGAALRPVEVLRQGAQRITGAASEERLPAPPADDEIGRLATTLNDMLDRLAAARARQRAFVADAAHELRSPLASLRTQIEVAGRLGEPVPSVADDLLSDVDRLSRVVEDLLLLARAEDGPARPDRLAPVAVRPLVTAAADRLVAPRVPVTVTAGPAPTVPGDADGLARALDNLLHNAVRHAATRVELSIRELADVVEVSVTDDGPGIPAADRERAFDRFTRLDEARARDDGGSGLGLAIVREIVRRHGGAVSLHEAGPGLRAVLCLPALADGEARPG
ncbi:HAMP domain-containing sensor histidine kinase [Pilimelia columellifera]